MDSKGLPEKTFTDSNSSSIGASFDMKGATTLRYSLSIFVNGQDHFEKGEIKENLRRNLRS